ncbi:MAG: DUF5702 domain-containing protein [Deltaproteobacteria bacterium]
MIKRETGAITVYLCIIFIAMIVIAGILIDAARISTAEIQIKRSIDSAVSSVLAGYDKTLKDKFGLFVLNDNNAENIRNAIKEYIASSLLIDKSSKPFLDLYGYRVEDIKAVPVYNLTENPVIKRQIVEYMKYRAPKQVAESFVGKAKAMADTGKIVELSEMKMRIDKVFMDIANDTQNINQIGKQINKFDYNYFQDLVKEYTDSTKEYLICKKKVLDIRKKVEKAREAKDSLKKTQSIASLLTKLYSALSMENKAKNKKEKALVKVNKYLEMYSKLCENAIMYCNRLRLNIADIKIRISSLKEYVNSNINNKSSDYIKNLSNEILRGTNAGNRKTCINEIEAKIPERQIVDELLGKIDSNFKVIASVSKEIKLFDNSCGISNEFADRYIFSKIISLKNFKNDIGLQVIKPPFLTVEGNDPRKEAGKKAKDKLKIGKDNKRSIIKEKQKELPSYKKKGEYPNKSMSQDFTKQDNEYKKLYDVILKNKSTEQNSRILDKENFAFENIQNEIDFGTNDFSEKAFDLVTQIGEWFNRLVTNGMISCRDELYVDEYILGMFSSAVPELKNGTNARKDLRGRQKQNTVECEVEYILFGNTSDKLNAAFAKGQILVIRFAIDTVNVYRNPQKVEEAVSIASAASAWSFGLAEPVIQNLILSGWGMLDALNDLDKLMEGETVPAFKKFEDSSADKNQLGLSYHDYLRIFLLMENSDDKINRIQDLIQLKSGKKLSGYNSYIRVEADISMKYLFITKAFMPASVRTRDGSRHNFKIVLYRGY